jgi:hypothetical protein
MAMVERFYAKGMKLTLGYVGEDTQLVLASDYDALAAELAGYVKSMDEIYPRMVTAEYRIRELEAILREAEANEIELDERGGSTLTIIRKAFS